MKQVRIVTLGDWNNYLSYFLVGSMEGAVRNGAWFRPVTLIGQPLKAIENQILFFKPHILLCHCIFNTQPHRREDVFSMLSRIKKSGIEIYYHMGDARTEPRYCGDISSFVSAGLMNHEMTEEFSDIWKVPCYHWPYGSLYQSSIADPDPLYEADVVFTGSLSRRPGNVHYERTKFLNKLKKKLRTRIFPDKEIGNTSFQTAELSAAAKSVIDIQMRGDIPGYLNVRPFQYIGSGALFFHDDNTNIGRFFSEGKHFVGYEPQDAGSFLEKWKYYVLKYPDKGDRIRREGFEYCQRYHSTKERMKFVIDLYKGNRPTLHRQKIRFKIFDEAVFSGKEVLLDGKKYKILKGKHSIYIPDMEIKIIWSVNGKIESFKDWEKGSNADKIREQSFNEDHPGFDAESIRSLTEEYLIFEELSRAGMSPHVGGFVYIKNVVSDFMYGVPVCDSSGVYGFFMQNANSLKSAGTFNKEDFFRFFIDTKVIAASEGAIGDLLKKDNIINGYLVDVRRSMFDMIRLNSSFSQSEYQEIFRPQTSQAEIQELLREKAGFPEKQSERPFQSVLLQGRYFEGIRDTEARYKVMQLPENLSGKSVLDLGMQAGAMCLEAYRRGARNITGIDYDNDYVALARDLSRFNGYQCNYIKKDLNQIKDIRKYIDLLYGQEPIDIVFALSIFEYIEDGFWDLLEGLNWKTCFVESHNAPDGLESDHVKRIVSGAEGVRWCEANYLGTVADQGKRCMWRLDRLSAPAPEKKNLMASIFSGRPQRRDV